MDRSEAEARVKEVQRIMERTTLYTLLPGTPAIAGGALALAGCIVSLVVLRSFDFQKALDLPRDVQIALWVIWVLIGVLAVATEILWTRRAAKKLGVSPAARPARFAAFSLTPSVLVAVVLTARLMTDHDLRYLAGVWMMCYGTGLYAAGLFSLRLPRLLGLAFILLGAAALFLLSGYGILWVAASFGLLHILFGVAVQRRAQGAEA